MNKKPIHVFINKKKYDWDDPFGESEPGIPRSDENADIVHDLGVAASAVASNSPSQVNHSLSYFTPIDSLM